MPTLLLQIPPNKEWLIKNQTIYAALRNSISSLTGVDAEAVQNFCEAVSASSRSY